MSWIDEMAKGSFQIFEGTSLEAFQPLDFFHFYPMWLDLHVKRMAAAIRQSNLDQKKYDEIKSILPVPSSIRATLQKVIPSYKWLQKQDTEDHHIVANFLARILIESCPEDPFGVTTNPLREAKKESEEMESWEWNDFEEKEARTIGKLITVLGSIGHGLYSDLGADFSWDIYGPFHVHLEGKPYTLLIRHFPNLRPTGLWDSSLLPSIDEIKLYTLYENVEWKVAFVGCHVVPTKGTPVQGLRKAILIMDGKMCSMTEMESLIAPLATVGEILYHSVRKMDFEETKQKVLEQECYQQKWLMDYAGIDWKPTSEMIKRIQNKPIPQNMFPLGKIMSDFEEYKEVFGMNTFKKEVLMEK